MRIITPGNIDKEEKIEICDTCGCKFGFFKEEEVVSKGISVINCPTCGKVLLLGGESPSGISFTEKMTCNEKFNINKTSPKKECFKGKIG